DMRPEEGPARRASTAQFASGDAPPAQSGETDMASPIEKRVEGAFRIHRRAADERATAQPGAFPAPNTRVRMTDIDRDDSRRPDPDASPATADSDRRGKLTVFLGAAPGVGKTYAMLTRAGRLKAEGVDVVVGLAETHGRSETAALLDGLEVLPRLAGAQDG